MKNQKFEVSSIKHDITVGPVTIEGEPYVSPFQKKDTVSIQLRQVIKDHATYPSARVSNEKEDNLFGEEEFGFTGGQEFTSTQNRVAFMDIPVGTTVATIQAKLNALPDACIYKQLSHRPILTSGQMNAIQNPELDYTLDKAAKSQAIRYPENDATLANGTAGKLILDADGKIQYRATFFSKTEKADIDERGEVDYYVSSELADELRGIVINASLVAEQGI